ncbi:MAG: NAD-dependent epimerase/dehydratase family protein [Phycisphaeraceae bacterium]|nr:NAD-dependent epimerase/dehydratase family protein [Phycisphaerales bacterium]MCB9859186.1 NAD-dependent epimerase/dehydratase family protein [Phycisphaeraceae bacterium]
MPNDPSETQLPITIDWTQVRVVVTGASGFLGRNVVNVLRTRGVPVRHIATPSHHQYDLTQPGAASAMLREAFAHQHAKPDVVIHCAGFVGGLGANRNFPARMFHDNMAMALNLVEACRTDMLPLRNGRIVLVGSMVTYPADAPVPFHEDTLWEGKPEQGSFPYAVAKLASLELLRAYHTQHGLPSAYVIPTNLYGPGDNFDPATSHAAAAIIERCVIAAHNNEPTITNWGSGKPTRQFLYIEDAAKGVVAAAERVTDQAPVPINLGTGQETSLKDFVQCACDAAGFTGDIQWDTTKPDGVARRSLDRSRAKALLGWHAATPLHEGVANTVAWYRENMLN